MAYAGSAIKQGAGIITDWDDWRPWKGEYLWLLMGGAMDPPKHVQVSARKSRDVAKSLRFLYGMQLDLRNMQQALIKGNINFENVVSNLKMTKKRAEDHLKDLFEICKRQEVVPVVYYTGHGQIGTGNWCFADGTISIQEIEKMLPNGCDYPLLISDTCYSGHWANYCLRNPGRMHCLAAAPEFATAWDTEDGGGELTEWMTGGSRPRTEPIWSKGSRKDFPITTGYKKGESATTDWGKRSTNKELIKYVRGDGFGFGTFYFSGFGDAQMTKGTQGFTGKKQNRFTKPKWREVVVEISKAYKEIPRKIVTLISFSKSPKGYFIVMTESDEVQAWMDINDPNISSLMDERYEKGYRPTIIFKNKKMQLIAMTTMPNLTE